MIEDNETNPPRDVLYLTQTEKDVASTMGYQNSTIQFGRWNSDQEQNCLRG
jgi:hypothetical protein